MKFQSNIHIVFSSQKTEEEIDQSCIVASDVTIKKYQLSVLRLLFEQIVEIAP